MCSVLFDKYKTNLFVSDSQISKESIQAGRDTYNRQTTDGPEPTDFRQTEDTLVEGENSNLCSLLAKLL